MSILRSRRPDLRAEVLRLAAKRDRALGEEFLSKLDDANRKDSEEATRQNRENENSSASASAAAEKRLSLARRLLEDGDVQRAMEFAGPVLDQINAATINFLSALREKTVRRRIRVFFPCSPALNAIRLRCQHGFRSVVVRLHTFPLCNFRAGRWLESNA